MSSHSRPSHSSSSSSSFSFSNSQGAGASSSASATSPNGQTSTSQDSSFIPGADSARATAQASASDQAATTSANVDVPAGAQTEASDNASAGSDGDDAEPASAQIDYASSPSSALPPLSVWFQIGTAAADTLESTPHQDIFWGGGGADMFLLGATGAAEISQADVILAYTLGQDQLALSHEIAPEQVAFEAVDINGDGTVDSTAVRSLLDDTVLAIVIDTVDEAGQTQLSIAELTAAPTASPDPSAPDPSGASASPPAGDDNASAPAIADSEVAPDAEPLAEIFSTPQAASVDFLTGTAEDDAIAGSEGLDVMLGQQRGDRFRLSINNSDLTPFPDVIVGFSVEAGDRLQFSGAVSLENIIVESIDLTGDDLWDGVCIGNLTTGERYAIILNTHDTAAIRNLLTVELLTAEAIATTSII